MKQNWKPGTLIYPVPAVMVSCGSKKEDHNIITVGWTGILCSDPVMCYISLRPERHSYDIIKKDMEFVINLTTEQLAYATDWCGVKSGRDFDKFKEMKLTPGKSQVVQAPYIEESPLCIECRVREVLPLGSHDMFLSEVVNVLADEQYFDSLTGAFDLKEAGLMAYVHGKYYRLGEMIGKFGWSVQRKKK